MTTQEIINYYANLLIMQYAGKPKAYATIQALVDPVVMRQPSLIPTTASVQIVTLSGVAASGAFVFNYGGVNTASIAWNDSAATIQTKLRAISGLGSITVAGSIASQNLTVTFTGVTAPATLLTVLSVSLLTASSVAIFLSPYSTEVVLPVAVLNGFNIITAVGVQLDVIGKYFGISRVGFNFSGPVTLNDADFRAFLGIVVIRNALGSELSTIQTFINTFFKGTLSVFDHQSMRMSYYYNVAVGSNNAEEFFIKLGLLPKPMGVQLSTVTYNVPAAAFFGFRTTLYAGVNISPMNSVASYQMTYPWLSAANGITV